jgi:heat shock protein HtpX
MIDRILTLMGAQALDPEDSYHRQLLNVVEEMSVASGIHRFEVRVINSQCLNAFALEDFQGRAVLGVTEGLLSRLNRRQVEAVIGHEASHVLWGDCLTATVACAVGGAFAGGLRGGLRREDNALPAVILSLTLFLPISIIFALSYLLNMFVSREKERRADATAVRLTRDPASLAEALELIRESWRGSGLPLEAVAPVFIVPPRTGGLAERSGLWADLFSTHPPVGERVGVLLDMAHMSRESLEAGLRGRAREAAEAPAVGLPPDGATSGWRVLLEGVWQGPFDIARLAALPGLAPDTWIRLGDGVATPAEDFKELMPILKGGAPAPAAYACFLCRRELGVAHIKGTPVWRCDGCGGHLVRRENIARLLARENMDFSEQAKALAARMSAAGPGLAPAGGGRPSGKSCPVCGREMICKPFAAIYPCYMEVEDCGDCGVIWFDTNELEAVQWLGQAGGEGHGVNPRWIPAEGQEEPPPRGESGSPA